MVLGIDYGIKRIGVAVGEPSVGMAFAREPLLGTGSIETDAKLIFDYFSQGGFTLLLLGLPVLEGGGEGEQAHLTRALGNAIEALGATVVYWDERFTTGAAKRKLSHLRGQKLKHALDSEAARLMVEEYFSSADA
jgi:putative Holliday junction resolvase